MSTLKFNKGDVIFRQGDMAKEMYVILSGNVRIITGFETEAEKLLTILGEGQFLGEMGMIEVYPRSATAVAQDDGTELQVITEADFSDYFEGHPDQLLLIMRQLSERLRERTADYQEACRTLEELKETKGKPDQRSKSLKDRTKSFVALYNRLMSNAAEGLDYEGVTDPYLFWYR